MTDLKVGSGLALPLDAVTRTTAIVGQRGTGKTSTAVVLVEEAARAGAQVAVVDPTGAWYGLRSSADGKGAGLEVVVFGGHHGDVPLEPGAGAFVARLVVEQGISVVLDLELMTKGRQVQFVAEFAEELYHRNRTALTLVIDEAHRFAPQQLRDPGGYGARCLGAVTDVVTLGRRKGLGAILISQRPAKINKDVFEQAEIMVAHRLMGPNDRKAIAGWLDEAVGETEDVASLPGLKPQHAIVWAPSYGVYGSYAIRAKRTFDSSATPEIGAKVAEPKGRADVDLAAIEEAMSETIERARAEDPKALQARIRQLESQVRELQDHPPVSVEMVEVPTVPDFIAPGIVDLHGLARTAAKTGNDVLAAIEELRGDIEGFKTEDGRGDTHAQVLRGANGADPEGGRHRAANHVGARANAGPRQAPARPAAVSSRGASGPAPSSDLVALSRSQQAVLDALASLRAIGLEHPGRTQVALLAGVSPKSSGFEKNLSTLRTAGLIDYPTKGLVCATPDGADAGHSDAPATVDELHVYVRRLIGESRWRVLEPLIATYPDDLTREAVADAAGVSPQSSGFEKNLSTLRSFGLIDYPQRGWAVALPVLFLESR